MSAFSFRFASAALLATLMAAGGQAVPAAAVDRSAGMEDRAAYAPLRVRIEGIAPGKGPVRLKVYASPETFLEVASREAQAEVSENGETVVEFPALPPGAYAVVAYHDRNANGVIDRGLFGVPLEAVGFSTGFVPSFSRPDFSDVRFMHDGAPQEIAVRPVDLSGQAGS